MKWISEEDLKEHIIRDNCDEGCGYIDERDIIDMEWVEDDKFIPLSVIGSVLDRIRAEIKSKKFGLTDTEDGRRIQSDIHAGFDGGIECALQIIDKYKASPTGEEVKE